jgi:nucleoside-diphosphate-sugar epimerase
MNKIAVVGGSGFIGTALIDQLKHVYKIQNLDKRESSISDC